MEKEIRYKFVPYDLVVELKELGFKEPCIARVNNYGAFHIKGTRRTASGAVCTIEVDTPLWQDIFDWLLLNHRISTGFEVRDEDFCDITINWGNGSKNKITMNLNLIDNANPDEELLYIKKRLLRKAILILKKENEQKN